MYNLPMKENRFAVERFVDLCQSLAKLGFEVGSSGNLSIRGDDGIIYITPSGAEFNDIAKNNVSIIKESTGAMLASQKPSSDLASHLSIYDARKDVKVILHTHAHPIVLSAIIGEPIPVLNTMHADYFGSKIQATPYSNHRKTGLGLSEYFKKGNVFLLAKHGGLLLFPELSIATIVSTMRAFNEVCSLYYDFLAISHHPPEDVQEISDDDLNHIHAYYQTKYGEKSDER